MAPRERLELPLFPEFYVPLLIGGANALRLYPSQHNTDDSANVQQFRVMVRNSPLCLSSDNLQTL